MVELQEIFPFALFAFYTVTFFKGFVIPFIISIFFITLIGLLGEIWNWIQTNWVISYATYGICILIIFFVSIIKAFVYGTSKMDDKVSKLNVLNIYIKHIYKCDKFHTCRFIWLVVVNMIKFSNVILLHYFTTLSLGNFILWFCVMSGISSLIIAIITITLFIVDKKKAVIEDSIGWIEILHFIVQIPMFQICILIAYWPLYKVTGLSQRISMLIGCGIYGVIEVTIIVITQILNMLFGGTLKKWNWRTSTKKEELLGEKAEGSHEMEDY